MNKRQIRALEAAGRCTLFAIEDLEQELLVITERKKQIVQLLSERREELALLSDKVSLNLTAPTWVSRTTTNEPKPKT